MPKQAAATEKTAVRGSDRAGRSWRCSTCWAGAGPCASSGSCATAPLTSRALRTACDEASPTVLQARLSELREAGLVELVTGDGYRLTRSAKT